MNQSESEQIPPIDFIQSKMFNCSLKHISDLYQHLAVLCGEYIGVCFSPTGVFGELDLHGIPRSIYKTKLSETAEAGSKVLSLMDAVDWQVEEILFGRK